MKKEETIRIVAVLIAIFGALILGEGARQESVILSFIGMWIALPIPAYIVIKLEKVTKG